MKGTGQLDEVPMLPSERFAHNLRANDDEAGKLDAKAEAEDDQAEADRAKADAARMASDLLPSERARLARQKCACGPGGCTCGGGGGDLMDSIFLPPVVGEVSESLVDIPESQGMSYMSVQHLASMQKHAEDLLQQIGEDSRLPDWIESKLARASQQLLDVYEYMAHGRQASQKLARVKEFELSGLARDLRAKDLRRMGASLPFPGRDAPHLETTGAEDSKAEALKAAEKLSSDYTRRNWPGGMSEVVALVEFPDHPNEDETGGVWVGVVNHYYSFS